MLPSTRNIGHQTEVSLTSRPPGFPRVSCLCDSCHTGSELGHVGALEVLVQPERRCAGRRRPNSECLLTWWRSECGDRWPRSSSTPWCSISTADWGRRLREVVSRGCSPRPRLLPTRRRSARSGHRLLALTSSENGHSGRFILRSTALYRVSPRSPANSGSVLILISPGSRCTTARSNQSKAFARSPRNA